VKKTNLEVLFSHYKQELFLDLYTNKKHHPLKKKKEQ